ncbi:MAG: hypothetical protein ACSHYA_05535 [Opitutaceae bacterium]
MPLLKLLAILCIASTTLFGQQVSRPSTRALTIDQVMERYIEAMGGLSNWDAIESIRFTGTLKRDDQLIQVVIVKKRPSSVRVTATIPIPGTEDQYFQSIRAHNGVEAWRANRRAGMTTMSKESIVGEDAKDLLRDAGVQPRLMKLWQDGHELELVGWDTIEGEPVLVIDSKQEVATETERFYLSTRNFRLVAYDIKSQSDTIRTRLSDYKAHEGVYIPTQSIVSSERTGKTLMITETIETGIGIFKEYFGEVPAIQTVDL